MTIRVFLISNHQLAAWGLSRLLETTADKFQLIVSAVSLDQSVLQAAIASNPDIILIDFDAGQEQILTSIQFLRQQAPLVKIILFTSEAYEVFQDHAVMCGAQGVISRNTSPDTILSAIEKVQEGQLWLNREATARIFLKFSQTNSGKHASRMETLLSELTQRERQIVFCFAHNGGHSGKALASKLHISESTLRNHLTAIYDKLGVHNQQGLMAFALQQGLDKLPAL